MFEKIIDTVEWGSFLVQWNPPSSATFSAPSQAIYSVDNHHRWIHNVIIGKGVGASMYRTNQMCQIDQASFSCIFLAAIPNSNNYFRKELSDSHPGDSKPSSLSEKFQYMGGRTCVRSSELMPMFKCQPGTGKLWQGRGGSWPEKGEQLNANPVRAGSVKILKRKSNFSLSFQKTSTWCCAGRIWKESVPSFFYQQLKW